ncbi:hypothetical protein PBI_SMARTIES_85 [Microbacterium phage Smarties]|uniref:Uncharacterized protein n=1 Tax=Microbacterium phage Ariadne TaxID=2656546 RepID=A0A649VAV5_9CAUD|nr:hypothetical protein QDA10_gp085 [Microbacterium phage Ariadne]QGJ89488.1 hypothetical protein PBI_ARIADNE_85 [Microbacterium phage Ariadne]QGJ91475.1 hypothetical protein PBI_SMARTIES_85 [Microbacterium phage Smarties]
MSSRPEPIGKVRVTLITRRVALEVMPSMLRGGADRIEVDACVKCGALVIDPIVHDNWHRSLTPNSD